MDYPSQAYESTYETRVVSEPAICNTAFLKSSYGILKLVEIILSFIVLMCVVSLSGWSSTSSGGWVNFVAAFTLTLSALLFIFYSFNLITRFPKVWVIIEFFILVLSTILWFIAVIVAATVHYYGAGAIAAAVFGSCACAVYIAELITRSRVTRGSGQIIITMTGISTAQPTVTPTTNPTVHSAGPTDGRMGFVGSYPQNERHDEGYVMP